MDTKLACLSLFLLLPTLTAQVTSPPGYLTKEGEGWEGIPTNNSYSSRFGGLADGRFQQVDGELRKHGPRTLRGIGFRVDRQASAYSTAGRSWSDVTLRVSDGDFDTMSRTFGSNALGRQTTVFSGPVRWPTQSAPSQTPAPWSADLRFAWRTPYAYPATRDLCLDWQFQGGTLENGSAWSGRRVAPFLLDALHHRYGLVWSPRHFQTTRDCRDSGSASGYAYSGVSVGTYGPAYRIKPQFAGKAVAHLYGANTAPNALVLQAVGLRGSTPGTRIGARCNNLMVDLSTAFLFQLPADGAGRSGWLDVPMGDLAAWSRFGKGLEVWSQGAWADSRTGALSLTAATVCNPDFALRMNQARLRRETVFAFDSTATSGWGPYAARDFNPIARFE